MRKQLKKALESIALAQTMLKRVAQDEKVPSHVKIKASKIADALDIDIAELQKIKSYDNN